MGRGTRRVLALFLLATALVLAACGGRPAAPGGEAAKSYTIGVALASATHPLYVAMKVGLEEQAAAMGNVNLRFVQAEEDPVRQLNGIQDLIAQGVDGLLVSPIDAQAAIPGYEAAQAAKIPIFSVARSVDPQYQDAHVGADWSEYGAMIAEHHVAHLGGSGTIALVKGPAGASFVMEMEEGFKRVVSNYPDIKIVAEGNTMLTKDEAARLASDFLTAHPDLDAIFANTDEQALGIITALEDRGLAGKVFLSGFDGIPPAVAAMREGKMHFTIALRPVTWGKKSLVALIEHIEGTPAPALVPIDVLPITQADAASVTDDDLR